MGEFVIYGSSTEAGCRGRGVAVIREPGGEGSTLNWGKLAPGVWGGPGALGPDLGPSLALAFLWLVQTYKDQRGGRDSRSTWIRLLATGLSSHGMASPFLRTYIYPLSEASDVTLLMRPTLTTLYKIPTQFSSQHSGSDQFSPFSVSLTFKT